MPNYLSDILRGTATRHYRKVAAFAVLLVGLSIILWLNWPQVVNWFKPTVAIAPDTELTNTFDGESLERAAPTRILIPKIEVDTTFETPLELNEDGTIEVPDSFDKVGWYKLGAAPGEVGTASILGHVDSYVGPEVFYSLGRLEEGDEILIERSDGTTAVFAVEKLQRYSQDDFPGEEVYGMTDYPSLRLITCTGSYDHGEQRYSHNLVVFAKLVEGRETAQENN